MIMHYGLLTAQYQLAAPHHSLPVLLTLKWPLVLVLVCQLVVTQYQLAKWLLIHTLQVVVLQVL
jgi:hypothetical protein